MPNPLVSVIVPIYNVEPYLFRCVHSLQAQTLKEIEIILVDDGSPDRCGELCDTFSLEDPRIVTIHKENGGLPSARNAGLAIAKGEYIGFVDSDDWVAENMFEELYRSAKADDADLVICDYVSVADSCTVVPAMGKPTTHISEMLLYEVKPIACNKLFRRSRGLRFYEELKFAEDRPTTIPFLTKSRRVAYVPKPLYYYFQRGGSIIDGYARNMAFSYDIQSMRLTIQDSDPRYKKQVAKYCIDILKWTVARRPSSKADMVEFLQEIYPVLRQNHYVAKSARWISRQITRETIPKRLVYFDQGQEGALSGPASVCRESWKKYGAGLEFVVIDENSYERSRLPACVRSALERREMQFVSGYCRLRYIYEHGGISVDDKVRLNSPLGELRANSAFFGFRNGAEISEHIFGGLPKAEVLREILATYVTDSILNDDSGWSLGERIYTVLKQFGMEEIEGGASQNLEENVKVYGYEYLSYRVNSRRSIAQIFDEAAALAEENGMILIDPSISVIFSEENNYEEEAFREEEQDSRVEDEDDDPLNNSSSQNAADLPHSYFNSVKKMKYPEEVL